jgi:hypothetical protein
VNISVDGNSRAMATACLWRSMKYEYLYLDDNSNVQSLHRGLKKHLKSFNLE